VKNRWNASRNEQNGTRVWQTIMPVWKHRMECAVAKLIPDRYLIGETLKEKEKATMSAGNTMAA
jgi:hypothetical protein